MTPGVFLKVAHGTSNQSIEVDAANFNLSELNLAHSNTGVIIVLSNALILKCSESQPFL